MSNSEIDKLIDRIPKENKYMVTTEEVVNYIYMLENRIDKAIEYINKEYDVEPKELYGLVSADELLNILRGEDK